MTNNLTSSSILRAARTPQYNVSMAKDNSLKVSVTGVPASFSFYVDAGTVREFAPFRKVTRESAMRCAHELAQAEVKRRGYA